MRSLVKLVTPSLPVARNNTHPSPTTLTPFVRNLLQHAQSIQNLRRGSDDDSSWYNAHWVESAVLVNIGMAIENEPIGMAHGDGVGSPPVAVLLGAIVKLAEHAIGGALGQPRGGPCLGGASAASICYLLDQAMGWYRRSCVSTVPPAHLGTLPSGESHCASSRTTVPDVSSYDSSFRHGLVAARTWQHVSKLCNQALYGRVCDHMNTVDSSPSSFVAFASLLVSTIDAAVAAAAAAAAAAATVVRDNTPILAMIYADIIRSSEPMYRDMVEVALFALEQWPISVPVQTSAVDLLQRLFEIVRLAERPGDAARWASWILTAISTQMAPAQTGGVQLGSTDMQSSRLLNIDLAAHIRHAHFTGDGTPTSMEVSVALLYHRLVAWPSQAVRCGDQSHDRASQQQPHQLTSSSQYSHPPLQPSFDADHVAIADALCYIICSSPSDGVSAVMGKQLVALCARYVAPPGVGGPGAPVSLTWPTEGQQRQDGNSRVVRHDATQIWCRLADLVSSLLAIHADPIHSVYVHNDRELCAWPERRQRLDPVVLQWMWKIPDLELANAELLSNLLVHTTSPPGSLQRPAFAERGFAASPPTSSQLERDIWVCVSETPEAMRIVATTLCSLETTETQITGRGSRGVGRGSGAEQGAARPAIGPPMGHRLWSAHRAFQAIAHIAASGVAHSAIMNDILRRWICTMEVAQLATIIRIDRVQSAQFGSSAQAAPSRGLAGRDFGSAGSDPSLLSFVLPTVIDSSTCVLRHQHGRSLDRAYYARLSFQIIAIATTRANTSREGVSRQQLRDRARQRSVLVASSVNFLNVLLQRCLLVGRIDNDPRRVSTEDDDNDGVDAVTTEKHVHVDPAMASIFRGIVDNTALCELVVQIVRGRGGDDTITDKDRACVAQEVGVGDGTQAVTLVCLCHLIVRSACQEGETVRDGSNADARGERGGATAAASSTKGPKRSSSSAVHGALLAGSATAIPVSRFLDMLHPSCDPLLTVASAHLLARQLARQDDGDCRGETFSMDRKTLGLMRLVHFRLLDLLGRNAAMVRLAAANALAELHAYCVRLAWNEGSSSDTNTDIRRGLPGLLLSSPWTQDVVATGFENICAMALRRGSGSAIGPVVASAVLRTAFVPLLLQTIEWDPPWLHSQLREDLAANLVSAIFRDVQNTSDTTSEQVSLSSRHSNSANDGHALPRLVVLLQMGRHGWLREPRGIIHDSSARSRLMEILYSSDTRSTKGTTCTQRPNDASGERGGQRGQGRRHPTGTHTENTAGCGATMYESDGDHNDRGQCIDLASLAETLYVQPFVPPGQEHETRRPSVLSSDRIESTGSGIRLAGKTYFTPGGNVVTTPPLAALADIGFGTHRRGEIQTWSGLGDLSCLQRLALSQTSTAKVAAVLIALCDVI